MHFIDWLSDFAKITVALFIVLDPLALMPLVYTATSRLGPKDSRRLILRVAGGATVLLLFFTITGTWVLKLFGVTLDDLRIGGGLLLVITSLRLVINGQIGNEGDDGYRSSEAPLISPLLVGPGAITAAVVFATSHGTLITALAGIVAMAASLLLLSTTQFFHRMVGDAGTDLISRIVGVLIAAIGISYMRVGIMALINARG